ncbi:MAG: protein kinase [Akkermansiaceae bacterium]|nr:protein kinase [Akkermansiaceae bacterium]
MNECHVNALPAGTRLDNLIIGKVLGHGGFGITYQVRDSGTSEVYAVKELFPEGMVVREGDTRTVSARSAADEPDIELTRKQFVNEAQVLSAVNHPAVVKVHRLLKANGTFYMVMDYIEGRDLDTVLKQRGGKIKTQAELLSVFLPVMNGLGVLHSRGLVHKDVKPANIMIATSGRSILLDFGSVSRVQNKTVTVEQAVSAGYSPIEQYSSQSKQGAYTDIYSLAASMMQCITGEKPPSACDRISSDNLMPLVAHVDYVETFGAVFLRSIDRALQISAKDRPQSITQWISEMGVDGHVALESSAVSRTRFVIGRSRESDLVINDSSTSRSHAELSSDHVGRIYITDLGSANGTRVNHPDSGITEPHLLKDTDLVYLCENYPVPGSILQKYYRDWQQSGGRLKIGMTMAEVKVFSLRDIHIGPGTEADLPLPENAMGKVHLFYDRGWKLQIIEEPVKVDGRSIGLGIVDLNAFAMIDVGGFEFTLSSTSQQLIVARHCAIVLAGSQLGWMRSCMGGMSRITNKITQEMSRFFERVQQNNRAS